jgi:hypothetical protein
MINLKWDYAFTDPRFGGPNHNYSYKFLSSEEAEEVYKEVKAWADDNIEGNCAISLMCEEKIGSLYNDKTCGYVPVKYQDSFEVNAHFTDDAAAVLFKMQFL